MSAVLNHAHKQLFCMNKISYLPDTALRPSRSAGALPVSPHPTPRKASPKFLLLVVINGMRRSKPRPPRLSPRH
ncbi:hypothetical protein BKA66DRAFT_465985, partial [Pyrenochaeta sp. MPI-SDFR-AT-0127]